MKQYKFLSLLVAFAILISGCDDTNDNLVGSRGLAVVPVISDIESDYYTTELASSVAKFKVDLEEEDTVDSAEVQVTFKGKTVVVQSIESFPAKLTLNALDVIEALEISGSDVEVGDFFIFYVITSNGDISTRSQAALKVFVTCPPQPGVYKIDMHDAYGDGWQTTADAGGAGIKLICDGVLIAEFGMCSPYGDSVYECSGIPAEVGYKDATTTVTIPEGTQRAEWIFPGDLYKEISFEIYGPNDELLLASGTGEAAAGALTVSLCAE